MSSKINLKQLKKKYSSIDNEVNSKKSELAQSASNLEQDTYIVEIFRADSVDRSTGSTNVLQKLSSDISDEFKQSKLASNNSFSPRRG